MAARAPQNGDRVRRTDTGDAATYVDQSKGEVQVLLDTGPKVATTWPLDAPLEVVARRPRSCARCGGRGHHPFDCRERHAAPWE
jgi:hypothetical protein